MDGNASCNADGNERESKRAKIDKVQMTNLSPLKLAKNIEPLNSFVCGVCDTAMHFARPAPELLSVCSICSQVSPTLTIQLVCDNCDFYICCHDPGENFFGAVWKPSCYSSYYYDQGDAAKQQVYNRQDRVTQFSQDDQQRWLQYMWHDMVHNMSKFRAELQHASQVDKVNATNVSLIMKNLGLEMVKSLVRLFAMFESKLDAEQVECFSNLIRHERVALGGVALETFASLNRLKQFKWLVEELKLGPSQSHVSAATRGSLEILEYVLDQCKVDPSTDDNYAVRIASENGHLNIVERLLQDERVDPSAVDNHAISQACANGHVSVVNQLLQDNRVDPRVDRRYALQVACGRGHLGVVERLLQDYSFGCQELMQTSSGGHVRVVDRLLQDDQMDPSANDNESIRKAISGGHISVVDRLLQDDRVDIAAQDYALISDAKDVRILKYLYDRTGSSVCYMVDNENLMKKLSPFHNSDSLVTGGLCLTHMRRDVTAIPQDVIFTILSEWAALIVPKASQ